MITQYKREELYAMEAEYLLRGEQPFDKRIVSWLRDLWNELEYENPVIYYISPDLIPEGSGNPARRVFQFKRRAGDEFKSQVELGRIESFELAEILDFAVVVWKSIFREEESRWEINVRAQTIL